MTDTVAYYKGKPIKDCSREELIEALNFCGYEIQHLRDDRDRWREAGDPLKYLMSRPSTRSKT